MRLFLANDFRDPNTGYFEVVERKGRGHPDTLSDRLAELLSRTYSTYSLKKYGAVLRHQFDKLSLMGGKAEVRFGGGHFRSPIRLLLNGRITSKFGQEDIFCRDLLMGAAKNFLETELRNFDFSVDCRVIFEMTSNRTRGMTDSKRKGLSPINFRFNPRSLKDIPESNNPLANDTAVGCAWVPYTDLEKMVLDVETTLTSDATRFSFPWIGSDVKIMSSRINDDAHLTIACPQVSTLVKSAKQYKKNILKIHSIIKRTIGKYKRFKSVKIYLNTGDDHANEMFYLLYTGSCIESGDEGQVSRGNRLGGVISSRRPFSIEGLSGKNPSYHAGKVYSAAAWDIAQAIWRTQHVACEVYIVSQIDRQLNDPWTVIINSTEALNAGKATEISKKIIENLSAITEGLLKGKYPLT